MFYSCYSLENLEIGNDFIISGVSDLSGLFYNYFLLTKINITNIDTSQITDMSLIFTRCSKITSLDVSKFNTSKVVNISGMFLDCKYLTSIDIKIWYFKCRRYAWIILRYKRIKFK